MTLGFICSKHQNTRSMRWGLGLRSGPVLTTQDGISKNFGTTASRTIKFRLRWQSISSFCSIPGFESRYFGACWRLSRGMPFPCLFLSLWGPFVATIICAHGSRAENVRFELIWCRWRASLLPQCCNVQAKLRRTGMLFGPLSSAEASNDV